MVYTTKFREQSAWAHQERRDRRRANARLWMFAAILCLVAVVMMVKTA